MKAALLGTLIPLGYIFCGLIAARIELAHFVKPDGTYDEDDEAPLMATLSGIFWPVVMLGYGVHLLYKRSFGLAWLVQPKAVRDRKRREQERDAQWAREAAEAKTLAIRGEARQLAQKHDLPWPTQNPFRDDTGTIQHNPVGRPPMCEGK